jgi:tRNA nucleotidyltransferase (CCA-adding enzyme)
MRIAKDVVERLKFDNKSKDEIVDLVIYHDSDIYAGTRSVRRWLNKIGPVMLDKLLDVKMADIRAHSAINQSERIGICIDISDIAGEIEQDSQCFAIKQLAINGHDVMGLGVEAGPKVGEVLDHLLNKVIEEEIENDRCSLLEEVSRYLKGE